MVATNKNMIYYPSTGFPWAKAGNTPKLFLFFNSCQTELHTHFSIKSLKRNTTTDLVFTN